MDISHVLGPMLKALEKTADTLAHELPKYLIFIGVLLIGYIVSRIVAYMIQKISKKLIAKIKSKRHTSDTIENLYGTSPKILGKFVFWFLFLFFILTGIEALGFTTLTKIISWITLYIPHLLAAIFVFILGLWAGNICASLVERKGKKWTHGQADYLALVVKWSIILVAISMSLSQIGIHSELIVVLLGISMFCILGTVALALALSMQDTLKHYIATQTLKKELSIGDTIKMHDFEGQIIEFEKTALILQNGETKIRVPAPIVQDCISYITHRQKL